ncbi:MAG TPA: enolase C-terminal domain-like protein [Jatrophihabitantaceae bacterium]|nr:enolase C-terminal domain-like protein [Jatrophihabitantaceae bacterium]
MTVIDGLDVAVYRIPTDKPEADGTFAWDATTIVVAHPRTVDCTGIGYTYTTSAAAELIVDLLAPVVVGSDPMDVPGTWSRMVAAIRNVGRPGVASAAIAAVDIGLWDLKAKVLGLPLATLLGAVRHDVPIYGSGGFTSYTEAELCDQLAHWVKQDGVGRVKMKIGTDRGARETQDIARVEAARSAIGHETELFVDANGAYDAKQAVRLASAFRDVDVRWFEEPVSSDDLAGLRLVREHADIEIAAGEYGADLVYFERMCGAGAVDVLQADVTRCAGITEWQRVAAVAASHGLEISGHCAPTAHLAVACSVPNLRHLEYFHDHVRIEAMLFDGVSPARDGVLAPDLNRAGLGISLQPNAAKYRTDWSPR